MEDFGKRLLQEVFLQMEEMYLLNVDLVILLMRNQVLPIAEWDKQFSIFVRDAPGALQEASLRFVVEFMEKAVLKQKIV